MKLDRIPFPLWSPPHEGPWRIRWTRPSGETGVGKVTYSTYAEAEMWASRARDTCRDGCTYDPVPDCDT